MTTSCCNGDGSIASHCHVCRPTLLDAEVLAEVTSRFPLVRIVDIDTDWLPCSRCPDRSWFGPADAVAVITYTRDHMRYPVPVGECCVVQELADVPEGATDVALELFTEPATEGAAA